MFFQTLIETFCIFLNFKFFRRFYMQEDRNSVHERFSILNIPRMKVMTLTKLSDI